MHMPGTFVKSNLGAIADHDARAFLAAMLLGKKTGIDESGSRRHAIHAKKTALLVRLVIHLLHRHKIVHIAARPMVKDITYNFCACREILKQHHKKHCGQIFLASQSPNVQVTTKHAKNAKNQQPIFRIFRVFRS
jgi:hypothetical protein